TTTDVPHYPTSDYTPDFQDHMIATLDEVKAATSGSLYDSRTEDRFNGTHEPIDSKAGHIPNALLCSYAEAITELGTLKDFHALKELYKDVLPVENPIFYCGSGVTACVNILALHALGKDDVRLYPGSYSDWISYPENEVHP
ncbi:MAG: sulfurtransferase, partial [Exiguobacterium sp.]|nr:sulfurtransferase [Exiguobacterium sp.]